MKQKNAYIAIIDDDESVREALPPLIRFLGHRTEVFASAEEFLRSDVDRAKCLVLDIAMPGMSGTDLRRELVRQKRNIPTIFITAHGDQQTCKALRQEGEVECLLKPFTNTALLEALSTVLGKSQA